MKFNFTNKSLLVRPTSRVFRHCYTAYEHSSKSSKSSKSSHSSSCRLLAAGGYHSGRHLNQQRHSHDHCYRRQLCLFSTSLPMRTGTPSSIISSNASFSSNCWRNNKEDTKDPTNHDTLQNKNSFNHKETIQHHQQQQHHYQQHQ